GVQGGAAGSRDRTGRQTLVLVGVVRAVGGALLVGRPHTTGLAGDVVDGRVELELHRRALGLAGALETVVDRAHDLPVVLGVAHLHLRERGDGERLVPLLLGDLARGELLLHRGPHHGDDVLGGGVLGDVVAAGPEIALHGLRGVLGDAGG